MPTRTEIIDRLACSQADVLARLLGLSQTDLERPLTTSDVPGASAWRAKDHLTHLTQSERNIQNLLRHALSGDTRDALLRLQYPADMPLPRILGNWDALSPKERQFLTLAVARTNQASVDAHLNDSLDMLIADSLAARHDTLELLAHCSDEQLDMLIPTVVCDVATGELFASRANHAAEHLDSIDEGLRRTA